MNYNIESPKLDLKLNLSPPRDQRQEALSPREQAHVMISSTEISPRSSCVSCEQSPDDETLGYSSSIENRTMMLVGCPRCLMYVMMLKDDPKCPKCKSTVLLDFLREDKSINKKK